MRIHCPRTVTYKRLCPSREVNSFEYIFKILETHHGIVPLKIANYSEMKMKL